MVGLDFNTTGKDILTTFGSNIAGATILITGSSEGGLGAETALTLASAKPGHLILAGRNETKIHPVIDRIKQIDNTIRVTYLPLDLCSNDSVRAAAAIVNSSEAKIDVLVNNAGICGQKEYNLSADGVERHFSANHLGHFLLTNLIIDKLVAAKGTIVNVSSMAYTLANVDTNDVNFDGGKDYNGWVAYARSKTANILFTFALSERLGEKVAVFATDPGSCPESNLHTNGGIDDAWIAEGMKLVAARMDGKPLPKPRPVSMQQAIASTLLVFLDPSFREKSPAFVKECDFGLVLPYAKDPTTMHNLWTLSEELVGQKFSF